jgi:CheY-like chemotaxis protein
MRTLLLADDNVTVQRVIALTFAREPVRVVTASDGHQAMDRVVVDRPDIVLAGTTLPQVNGYDLARFVKSKAESRNVPVLLLSGAFETVDEAQLKSSGANGVIEKPVEPLAVISRVKELLGITSGGDAASTAVARTGLPGSASDVGPSAPLPTAPRLVTSTRPMPPEDPPREAPEAGDARAGDDYLESLETAFNNLDQQLAGRVPATASQHRNPAPPLGRTAPADPRSPGKRPADGDDSGNPVYEVDEDWFAEDPKAGEGRELEQRQLAAEMGISQVPEVPEAAYEPIARTLPIDWFAIGGSKPARPSEPGRVERVASVPQEPPVIEVRTVAPIAGSRPDGAPGRVADDFAALLAFERGEKAVPPMIEPIMHAATPDITPEMLEQIATTVADRLTGSIHVEPKAPEITGEMIKLLALLVAGTLKDTIRVDPAAPEISDEMLKTIALLVSGHLRDQIHVEPVAPVLTDAIVGQIAGMVAERLTDRVHVEPKAPEITDGMLDRMAGTVANWLKDSVHVEPVAPQLDDGMLDRIGSTVADRLRDSVHVEAKAPEITDAMLERVSETVAARLKDSIRVEPAIPELNGPMLDQIAGTVAERLRDSVRVETVAPAVTGDMLEHLAHRVSEHLHTGLQAAAKPEVSDETLDRVAARVAERLRGSFSIDELRDPITAAIRDTVRTVVAETSDRLVREEIERIKAKAQ